MCARRAAPDNRRAIEANTGMPAAGPDAPQRAGVVLGSLIAVAAVANLGLAVANVALPSIGTH
jgi:MFS transporter, DHA2 family, multidrug resistance protein